MVVIHMVFCIQESYLVFFKNNNNSGNIDNPNVWKVVFTLVIYEEHDL